MGIFLALIFICFFYCIPIFSIQLAGFKYFISNIAKKELAIIFLTSLGFFSLIVYLMAKEQYIYFWDYGAYWYKTLFFQSILFSDPVEALKLLFFSINTEEYNYLASVLMSLPLKLSGNSYCAFVILNVFLFYIPNAFLMAFTFYKIAKKYLLSKLNFLWIYFYTLTFSIGLFPVLDGYIDVIGMLPLTSAYLLIIDRTFEKHELLKNALLGICILWIVLLRRYYAYAVIGGTVFTFLFWLLNKPANQKFSNYFKGILVDSLSVICIPGTILLIFFHDFLINSFFNNHHYAYSAYRSSSILGEWIYFIRYFGIIFILFAIWGIIFSFKTNISKLTISLLMNLLITCILFFRIADMGEHHYYTVLFPMCFFIFLGMHVLIFNLSPKNIIQKSTKILVIISIIINFSMSIGIGDSYKSILQVSRTFTPKVRHDISILDDLEDYLSKLMQEGYNGIYCLGSSDIFNSDILAKLDAPDIDPLFSNIMGSHVDLRDGFNPQFFNCDIILACDPVQYHLNSGQDVIIQLNEIMISSNLFSDKYNLKNMFTLDNNVKVLVYTKERPLNVEDIKYIRDIYENIYPDYPDLFTNRIDTYISENF